MSYNVRNQTPIFPRYHAPPLPRGKGSDLPHRGATPARRTTEEMAALGGGGDKAATAAATEGRFGGKAVPPHSHTRPPHPLLLPALWPQRLPGRRPRRSPHRAVGLHLSVVVAAASAAGTLPARAALPGSAACPAGEHLQRAGEDAARRAALRAGAALRRGVEAGWGRGRGR